MHPRVNSTYQKLAEKYEMKGPFLEIGVGNKEAAILSGNYFLGKSERFATNLAEKEILEEEQEAIQFVRCNSNNMKDVFADGQFGTVLSNAVIEHDKYFWRSLDEMKRILAPGGILAIGAPAYVPRKLLKSEINNEHLSKATITMDVHSAPDYWRFSRMAFREVICEGLELLEICMVGRIPVLLAVARKPLDGLLPPVAQEDRAQIYRAEKEAKMLKREGKLQAREAKLQTREPTEADEPSETGEKGSGEPRKNNLTKEDKLQKRTARLQERELKIQAREARKKERQASKETAGALETGEGEVAKPGERRTKGMGRVQKEKSAKITDDSEG